MLFWGEYVEEEILFDQIIGVLEVVTICDHRDRMNEKSEMELIQLA